jgi:hypothetical protein
MGNEGFNYLIGFLQFMFKNKRGVDDKYTSVGKFFEFFAH